jgi:uncharacterized protein (TIGR00255 family)
MKSMTGYGLGEARYQSKKITFEVKTVNHRFCEVNLRLPSRFYPLEAELSEFTKKAFSRGRIDIFIRESGGNNRGRVKIDETQLTRYLKILKDLTHKTKARESLRPEALLTLPHVIVFEEEEEDLKEVLALFKQALEKVFTKVEKMREKEGEGLKDDFVKRLDLIADYSQRIEEKIPELLEDYQNRLKDRIAKLTQQNPDEWRLAQEVAYFVDRTDVSEELQRLKSHVQHFKEVVKEKEPVGRKLDFILQEMNREVNTLGSKAQHSQVSQWVVACKHELEKMREQVQNVE